jgi:hypothetical protein
MVDLKVVIAETEVPAELDEGKFVEMLGRHADLIEEKAESATIQTMLDVIVT